MYQATITPNYRVPSRPHIKSICQKLYTEEKEKLMGKLDSRHVALTSDLWTSQAVQAYLTVTVHFINDEWALESYVLTTTEIPERHTGTRRTPFSLSAMLTPMVLI